MSPPRLQQERPGGEQRRRKERAPELQRKGRGRGRCRKGRRWELLEPLNKGRREGRWQRCLLHYLRRARAGLRERCWGR